MRRLPPGLYEAPLTEQLAEALTALESGLLPQLAEIDPGAAPAVLARHVHDLALRALRAAGASGTGEQRLTAQLELANRLVAALAALPTGILDEDRLAPPARELRAVLDATSARFATPTAPQRPLIPLRTSDLLVNGPRDLRLASEVRRELASADRVDLLLSFLKWSGVRILLDAFEDLLARRPGGLRVLTTAYLGATEPEALEALADRGATIRVSYDKRRTRLHAKAWLFHRESEFTTAFVGSSNLSAPAILDGVEWNVRLSAVDNRALLDKFAATFEQYWQASDFVPFDREAFRAAVRVERSTTTVLLPIALRPYPHQEEILEALAAERHAGHHRNLVVAATGTGKTLVAAFDYARLRREHGPLSLLFVAHREEILRQAQLVFRQVLSDGNFGELLVAGERPLEGHHVFGAVQSLHADRLAALQPDAYDVVIVDEFHHAAAETYERLLTHLRPRFLLGLTATPERADGRSVLGYFDGRVAAELRLWGALERGLLAPFQYFGIADSTDLSRLRWQGGYVGAELENLYTGDDIRTRLILRRLRETVKDVGRMRAFGFCAGVRHAEHMARRFTEAGIPARAVHAGTPREARREVLEALRERRLNAVFTVDLFNEGIDLPAADTILFLRPTESATVFLQQLGRGLRLDDDKDCLTVLDFIGNAHREFRFDARFRALLGGTRREIAEQIEGGFPRLPAGCAIKLERVAQEHILHNVRRALDAGFRGLVDDLRGLGDVPLAVFLEKSGATLEDVYRGGRCWSDLRRAAGLPTPPAGPQESALAAALGRQLHVDDDDRLETWSRWVAQERPPAVAELDSREGRLQAMWFAALGHVRVPVAEMAARFAALWEHPALLAELRELLPLLADRRRTPTFGLELGAGAEGAVGAEAAEGAKGAAGAVAGAGFSAGVGAEAAAVGAEAAAAAAAGGIVPIHVHGTYSLDEVMAAFGVVRGGTIYRPRGQGVWYDEPTRTDLLFVTLEKTEKEYSPTTMYADYPVSPGEFHWESQNSTAPWSEVGRRYLASAGGGRGGRGNIVLFVRLRRKDDRGITVPYLCLGRARLARSEGERPMKIVWRLETAMPAGWFERAKIAAA